MLALYRLMVCIVLNEYPLVEICISTLSCYWNCNVSSKPKSKVGSKVFLINGVHHCSRNLSNPHSGIKYRAPVPYMVS